MLLSGYYRNLHCARENHSQSLLHLSRKFEVAQTYAEVQNIALEELKSTLGYQSLWIYLMTEDKNISKSLLLMDQCLT